MKLCKAIFNFPTCFAILLVSSVVGCTSSIPTTTNSPATILTGQKPGYGTPPKTMMPVPPWSIKNAFSYDFNRDGMQDWVVVASHNTHDDWLEHSLNIALSQPDGKLQAVTSSNFDPSEKGDVPWRMSAKLTGSGDLRITNNKYTPMGGSDHQNSYRFHFINGEFVLQEYTFGYGSSTRGSTFIFDLANYVYREQQAGRCDYAPDQPCLGTKDAKLGNVPKVTLRDFGGFYALGNAPKRVSPDLDGANLDNVQFFKKYVAK